LPFAEILATGLFNATGNASEDTKRARALLRELKEIIEVILTTRTSAKCSTDSERYSRTTWVV